DGVADAAAGIGNGRGQLREKLGADLGPAAGDDRHQDREERVNGEESQEDRQSGEDGPDEVPRPEQVLFQIAEVAPVEGIAAASDVGVAGHQRFPPLAMAPGALKATRCSRRLPRMLTTSVMTISTSAA